ncbi:hypothetical protein [Streptomyces misionensis]|uniref:hypothetical protein n=1 Tax=Streptomyces misionensis TaxID=67331 RepID=UPI0033B04746
MAEVSVCCEPVFRPERWGDALDRAARAALTGRVRESGRTPRCAGDPAAPDRAAADGGRERPGGKPLPRP